MKSGTEPDDLWELSCSVYFVIKLLCPDVEPLLGSTAPLCKTEKRYSLGDTQLGKKKAPSSSFQSSRSCQTAELRAESVGWVSTQGSLCSTQPAQLYMAALLGRLLPDWLLHTHAWTDKNMEQVKAETRISLNNFLQPGEWPDRWEDEQAGRYGVGGKGVGCVRRSMRMISAALASMLDPSDEPAAVWSFFILITSWADWRKPINMVASTGQNVETLCLHWQLRPDCWASQCAHTHVWRLHVHPVHLGLSGLIAGHHNSWPIPSLS